MTAVHTAMGETESARGLRAVSIVTTVNASKREYNRVDGSTI